jgi:hypothetical protein
MPEQRFDAAHMIAVMMRAKNRGEPQSVAQEPLEDRLGIARIDNGYPVCGFTAEQPDVVVLESGDV